MLYFSITRVTNGAYHFCFINQGVGRRRFLGLLQWLICAFLQNPKFLLGGLFLSEPMCIDGLLIIRRLVFIILRKITWKDANSLVRKQCSRDKIESADERVILNRFDREDELMATSGVYI